MLTDDELFERCAYPTPITLVELGINPKFYLMNNSRLEVLTEGINPDKLRKLIESEGKLENV